MGLRCSLQQLLFHRNNLLSDLPHELGKCAQLRDVVLSYNRLTVLPAVLYTIKTIENVIADNNQV